ncbi:porin family protein [Novosphingobium sp. KCTC 2891]|uniref:outer membrane protein n=1 Tax=Novosphingobium sp. KCTC 2891 TaxID=2989730 RepID=UPI0022217638|nr:porin family protein [Novosphingobium sp. KCTC 2891]MCW1383685.1 porin family protein [Novosphingobium sp. KCTC 2891]
MYKKLLAAAVVASLAVATGAQAKDFTGPSVGVQGGWENLDVRNPSTDLGVLPLRQKQDSAVFGGFLGYDYQIGQHVVVGAQAELNFPTGGTFGTSVASLDEKRSIDVSARAGYLVTPKTLVYVRGGYTNARLGTRIDNGTTSTYASEDRDGWHVGGGVERMVTDHISARLEYRYTDLSNGDGKFDRHQVLAGAAYRF